MYNSTGATRRSFIGGGGINIISNCDNNSIVGGYLNSITGNNCNAIIGGGCLNLAEGTSGRIGQVIGGGLCNKVQASVTSVVGGMQNTGSGYASFIGGGCGNYQCSPYGSILGGTNNENNHNYSHIIGDSIISSAQYTTHINNLTVSGSGGTSVVMMRNLPTSDPSNVGQLWNDAGTLKISI